MGDVDNSERTDWIIGWTSAASLLQERGALNAQPCEVRITDFFPQLWSISIPCLFILTERSELHNS